MAKLVFCHDDTLETFHTTGVLRMGLHSVGRPEVPCSHRPFKPVTVRMLRDHFDIMGRANWMVTLVPVEGGYSFRAHPTYGYKETRAVVSEKTKQVRVFKTLESAVKLAKSYGFTEVAVEL